MAVPTDPADLDVDARFLLANERTMLAWVRTALALLLSGAGIEQFGADLERRTWFAGALLALGIAAAATGAVRHAGADRAIRHGVLPKSGVGHYAVAVAVAVVGVGLLVSVVAAS